MCQFANVNKLNSTIPSLLADQLIILLFQNPILREWLSNKVIEENVSNQLLQLHLEHAGAYGNDFSS